MAQKNHPPKDQNLKLDLKATALFGFGIAIFYFSLESLTTHLPRLLSQQTWPSLVLGLLYALTFFLIFTALNQSLFALKTSHSDDASRGLSSLIWALVMILITQLLISLLIAQRIF